jgi:hypothetical protein
MPQAGRGRFSDGCGCSNLYSKSESDWSATSPGIGGAALGLRLVQRSASASSPVAAQNSKSQHFARKFPARLAKFPASLKKIPCSVV